MSIRPVKRVIKSKPTLEGAGVHLRRAFGFGNTKDFDPFLLLDDFRNDVPEDYLAGFPWHPHRGIETITYVLAGNVEHGDSMGNRGVISSGDRAVDDRRQWHHSSGNAQGRSRRPDCNGFSTLGQPAGRTQMTSPRYQEVKALEIPQITDDDGTPSASSAALSGERRAPWMASPPNPSTTLMYRYRRAKERRCRLKTTRHAFAYVFAGSGKFLQRVRPACRPHRRHQVSDTTAARGRRQSLVDRFRSRR